MLGTANMLGGAGERRGNYLKVPGERQANVLRSLLRLAPVVAQQLQALHATQPQ